MDSCRNGVFFLGLGLSSTFGPPRHISIGVPPWNLDMNTKYLVKGSLTLSLTKRLSCEFVKSKTKRNLNRRGWRSKRSRGVKYITLMLTLSTEDFVVHNLVPEVESCGFSKSPPKFRPVLGGWGQFWPRFFRSLHALRRIGRLSPTSPQVNASSACVYAWYILMLF